MGIVSFTASGNSITAAVAGQTDILEVAEILAAFAVDKGINVDLTQVNVVMQGNIDRAAQYTNTAEQQSDIIEKFTVEPGPVVITTNVASPGDLQIEAVWMSDDALGIEVDGTLEFIDNVFTGTAVVDFVDVLTGNQPNDAFTFVNINLKEILGEMGVTGDVEIVQTNPALSFAYGASAFPTNTKTKTYTLANIDDEFNVLLMTGQNATLTVSQGGTLKLTISIDAAALVVNAA